MARKLKTKILSTEIQRKLGKNWAENLKEKLVGKLKGKNGVKVKRRKIGGEIKKNNFFLLKFEGSYFVKKILRSK